GVALGRGELLAAIEFGRRALVEARLAAQSERVVDVRPVAAPAAERPDRPAPDRVGADVLLDLVGVEAAKIVPLLVVFADVLEAEPAVVVEPVAREGRTEVAVQAAARRLADSLERVCVLGRRQRFGSPTRHRVNMCSGGRAGKRGNRWARWQWRLTTSFG